MSRTRGLVSEKLYYFTLFAPLPGLSQPDQTPSRSGGKSLRLTPRGLEDRTPRRRAMYPKVRSCPSTVQKASRIAMRTRLAIEVDSASSAGGSPDAIVIGSGPNGLSAAITLAQARRSVLVYEAEPAIGGGMRSAELTLPGFIHDVCSCVHPMALSSPFFQSLDLSRFGLRWVTPEAALAHPFADGDAAIIANPFEDNLAQFGPDAAAIHSLMAPLVRNWHAICPELLAPARVPRHVLKLARFGWNALQPAARIARRFRTEKARAVFAGIAAHSMLPMDRWISSATALVLWATGYSVGWPFAQGGSQSIALALGDCLQDLGGRIATGIRVTRLDELPAARVLLCDVTPRQFLALAGDRVSSSERRSLQGYRYGPGVFKLDWALDAPIPWKSPACLRAGTVHLGANYEEIAASESAAWSDTPCERPFVLLAQPSLFDPSRAPAGKHTAWAYCHVPHGSSFDMTDRIEAQVERFAPGFRRRILARSTMFPSDFERHNPNLIGGDIGAGSMDLGQFFARPSRRLYSTSLPGVFLCSASTPPGPGVHGMCGHFAARRALHCFSD